MVGAWGRAVSAQPLEGLETKGQPQGWSVLPVRVTDHREHLEHEGSGEHPWKAMLHTCCQTSLLGKVNVLHDSIWGTHLGAHTWSLLGLPYACPPPADLTLHPYIVINHNHEFNCFPESS